VQTFLAKLTGKDLPWTGAFPPGRGGGQDVAIGYKGKGLLIHLMVDGQGKPLLFRVTGANGDEREEAVNLLRECKNKVGRTPKLLQADRGYDSKRVRVFAECICKIDTDIPARQWDVARRGKYRRPKENKGNDRWKVERTFAWLYKKYRRLSSRWERQSDPFKGFIYAAICLFWLNSF
jgi:transposase